MKNVLPPLMALLLCSLPMAASHADAQSRTAAIAVPPAEEWEIGPIIRGRNYSVGMPVVPMPTRSGWSFDFPVGSEAAGHVHYVTFQPSLGRGATRIIVRYRINAAPGTRFTARESAGQPAAVSLYFQRRGDDWRARRGTEFYRWYAPAATMRTLQPGVHEMQVRIDDPRWAPVLGPPSPDYAGLRADAWANVGRVGIVFGSVAARGHGVYASAPARFTLLDFRIQ
jgi:hypothetical protein